MRRAELHALGLTTYTISEMLTNRLVREPFRGVYVDAALPDTTQLRVECLATVVDEHHVVRDRTAAAIHGIDVLTMAEHEVPTVVESSARNGRTRTRRPGVKGGRRTLLDRDVMRVGTVWVTTPLRTALDLGCNLRRRDAYAALNEFARLHGITAEQLLGELPRLRGRRGVRQLRELILLINPLIESPRESWVYLELIDAGIPAPQAQVWVEKNGVKAYRLDFAYPHHRICIEYDGFDDHLADPAQKERDDKRRGWLRDQGWTVVVVRSGDFTGNRLERWLDEVREALANSYSNRRW
ncbi:DUF559 domain-containing protein [Nocardioides terrae]|uniref:DUF559 domain-containing protein n=1 Tax=Nocardioides terrae TaxID=574651 RepID=UPI001FDED3BC|nr:DUF559 domain-containing protein [Nocardioides terrae]